MFPNMKNFYLWFWVCVIVVVVVMKTTSSPAPTIAGGGGTISGGGPVVLTGAGATTITTNGFNNFTITSTSSGSVILNNGTNIVIITNSPGNFTINSTASGSGTGNAVTNAATAQTFYNNNTFNAGLVYGSPNAMPSGAYNAINWYVSGNAAEAVIGNQNADYGFQGTSMNPHSRFTWSVAYSTTNATHYSVGNGGNGPQLTNSAGEIIGSVNNQMSLVVENEQGLINNMPMVGNIVNNFPGSIALSSSANYSTAGSGDYPWLFSYPSSSGSSPRVGIPLWTRASIFTDIAAWATNKTGVPVDFWGVVWDPKTGNEITQGSITASNGFTIGSGAGVYTGNGSGLTTLNASQITSGTIVDARLSTNVPLKNATQTWTGAINTFNGDTVINSSATNTTGQPVWTPLERGFFNQTASIGSIAIYTNATAGYYIVTATVSTQSAGSAGTVLGSLTWNDLGGAKTMNTSVGVLTATDITGMGVTAIRIYVPASQVLTFSTTVSGAIGSPTYYAFVTVQK